MKTNRIYTILALLCLSITIKASDGASTQPDSTKAGRKTIDAASWYHRPLVSTFQSGVLLNQITTENLRKQTMEFIIQHRFGNFQNGYQDLLGIYGNANIRIGFDYGITDWIQVGFGVTKDQLVTDFRAKVMLIPQKRGKSPVSVSYFVDMGVAGVKDTVQFPTAVDRLTYFHQIIISRRFADWFSLQAAISYMHYNIISAVDADAGMKHDNFAVSGGARFKISAQSSVLLEFDYPLINTGKFGTVYSTNKTYPNLGFGWEISTGAHTFQIFIASAGGILPQVDMMYNTNDFSKPKTGWLFGFNITRRWAFTGKHKKDN